jgi:hypothetical protein
MSEPRRFRVTGAVLTRRADGTVWTLTFSPESATGSPLDGGTEDIVITLPPAEVDNMLFDASYTKDDIDALRSGGARP